MFKKQTFGFFLFSMIIGSSLKAQVQGFNLRLAPIALIDFYNGATYKGGLELAVFNNNTITIEGGGFFNNFNGLTNINGYLIDVGFRHYLNSKTANHYPYFSVNYIYKNQSFDIADSIAGLVPYHVTYTTEKQVHCANLNVGKTIVIKQHLLVDVYGGIGIRWKDVNSSLSESELENAVTYNDSQSLYFLVTPGQFIYPNVQFGLRLGWIFI
jgi:hypothetical protein